MSDNMNDESTFSVTRSIKISPEQQRKVSVAGINLSEFVRNKLDEELTDDRLIENRISYHEEELKLWKERRERHEQRTRRLFDLSDSEIKFLVQSKELLDSRPEFIDGRIQLYRNRFGKHFPVSVSEFQNLMEIAARQQEQSNNNGGETNLSES